MGFQDFFRGKSPSVEETDTPTGLDLRGPRNAASRMATYVNRRPIYLAGGVVAILILGTAIALDRKTPTAPAPVHVRSTLNRKQLEAEQASLQQSAQSQAISTAPVVSPASSVSSAEPQRSFVESVQPSGNASAPAAPAAPASPSPKMEVLEASLKSGVDAAGGASSGLSAAPQPQTVSSNTQKLPSVSKPSGQGPSSLSDYNPHLLRRPVSPFEIDAGSVIPAVLETGINSDLPGTITALVSRNVWASASGAYLLIPAGTKLVGTYASSPRMGQSRVFVAWTELQFPNGTSMNLENFPGTSARGYAGFHDLVDNHTWRIFKNALLISLVETGSSLVQPGYGSAGSATAAITPAQVAEQNLANTFGQAEAQMLQSALNVSPTLKIRPGYAFNVLVPKTLVFPGRYRSVVTPGTPRSLKVAAPALANPYITGQFPRSGNAGGSHLASLLRSLEHRASGSGEGHPHPYGNTPIGSGAPMTVEGG